MSLFSSIEPVSATSTSSTYSRETVEVYQCIYNAIREFLSSIISQGKYKSREIAMILNMKENEIFIFIQKPKERWPKGLLSNFNNYIQENESFLESSTKDIRELIKRNFKKIDQIKNSSTDEMQNSNGSTNPPRASDFNYTNHRPSQHFVNNNMTASNYNNNTFNTSTPPPSSPIDSFNSSTFPVPECSSSITLSYPSIEMISTSSSSLCKVYMACLTLLSERNSKTSFDPKVESLLQNQRETAIILLLKEKVDEYLQNNHQ